MAGLHPDAGVAGNVFVGRYGADFRPVRMQDGPAGQVFFLVFVEVVLGVEDGTGEFVGVREVVYAGQTDEGAGVAPLGECFKIKGNRQSIEFDSSGAIPEKLTRSSPSRPLDFSTCPIRCIIQQGSRRPRRPRRQPLRRPCGRLPQPRPSSWRWLRRGPR